MRVARYLVGPYNNSWNFMDAIEKAQDGDTIEFENGYVFQWPTNKVIEIDKNLHFVGHVVPNPNGNGRMFNNIIEASFRFVEGAQVTFEDLWFKVGGNYTALLLWLSLIHISEPTRLGMISYAVFCLKKKKNRRDSLYTDHRQ